jgi:hypothetical protein
MFLTICHSLFCSSSLYRKPSFNNVQFNRVNKLYGVYHHENKQEEGFTRRVYRFSDSIRMRGPTFRVIHYRRESNRDAAQPEFVDLRISAIIQMYLNPGPGGVVVAQNNEAIPAEINPGNVPQVHNHNGNGIANFAQPAPLAILDLVPNSVFINVHIPDTRMILVLNQHFSYPLPSVGVRFYNGNHAVFMDGSFIASNNIVCEIPFQSLTMGR